jgi:hypothetical protein
MKIEIISHYDIWDSIVPAPPPEEKGGQDVLWWMWAIIAFFPAGLAWLILLPYNVVATVTWLLRVARNKGSG